MKDLKDFLNEGLITESLDTKTAEEMVFDILRDKAKTRRSMLADFAKDANIKVDDDKFHTLAKAIVDVFDNEKALLKVNKNSFKKYLEDKDYWNIFSAADVALAEDNMDETDHDLLYYIMGYDYDPDE